MANNKKVIDELENKLRELVNEKLTLIEIGNKLEISKETVRKYCLSNNLPIYTSEDKKANIYNAFLADYLKTTSITISRKKFKISHEKATKLIEQNNIEFKKLDRTMSIEEAQKKLPILEESKIIGFSDGKYTVLTKDGFTYKKIISKLYQGDPRGKCGYVDDLPTIKEKMLAIGYEVIDKTFINKRKPFEAICKKCNNIRKNRFSLFFTQNCGFCSNTGNSKQEMSVKSFVEDLGFETKKHRFEGKTKGKEIDIYIPSLILGIEYCGLYWHNENSPHPRERSYHMDKMKQANSEGIRLITIFEDEWNDRQIQVKNYLKSVLGIVEREIYGRKCEVKVIKDIDLTRQFLENNHIQGGSGLNIETSVGLYKDGELLGVITTGKHHREASEHVLNRMCFKDGVKVIGGASKMLKLLKLELLDKGIDKLITWSDNRWSEGNVYGKMGFVLDGELPPDYSYVKAGKRYSKQNCKKGHLIKRGGIGETESELAQSLGFNKIWDCGKKRWTIRLNTW